MLDLSNCLIKVIMDLRESVYDFIVKEVYSLIYDAFYVYIVS